jgi:HSP20 family protein
MALMRYTTNSIDPFQSLQETMNRFFNEPASVRPWVPAVDIRETENELTLKADIPDMKFEDIDVRLENGILSLRGERKFDQQKQEGGWHRVERSYGHFERVFTLPDTIDPEKVTADYKNGVLTINLPKKEIAKPRQVKVQISQSN